MSVLGEVACEIDACLLCGAGICGGPLDFQTSAGGRSRSAVPYVGPPV